MGATCAPGGDEEEQEEYNMEVDEDQSIEKFTKIINEYQADNEALRRQLEECKNEDTGAPEDYEERAKLNEEIMKELVEMKALVEAKNAMLVKGQVEAALLSRATTMLADGSTSKLCVKGKIKYVYKSGLTKSRKFKWVEVNVSEGKVINDAFVAGSVTLTYSDTKDATTSNRCKVLEVLTDDTKNGELFFILKVLVQKDSVKDMLFLCETVEERDEWVSKILSALAEVKEVFDSMHEEVVLKIKFEKEKLGFRVMENIIAEESECKVENNDEIPRKFENEVEAVEKTVDKVSEKVGKDIKRVNYKEKPCQLLVCEIKDKSLYDAGLLVSYVLSALNDIVLPGKGYNEQLELLSSAPKPLFLTFTGKKFVKQDNPLGYSSILKELVADGDNAVKEAFNALVKGTIFEEELKASDNQAKTIAELIADKRRLLALIQSTQISEVEL